MVNIAVLGYGTVGSGVVEVINKNHNSINKRAGKEINIKYVLDLREFPGDPVMDILVHDYNIILNDPEIEIVVEVMGGINPALEFTKSALMAGKSVCTSNKELVAAHGAGLLKIAHEKGVNFLFEASVGGGIPIIRPLNQSLTADEFTEITGILNGTTNYILTKMADEGSDFDTVLKSAQEKGYAERNPEADVEGYDACRKIAILTSLAYGKQVDYEDIYTEGITKITEVDIDYAKKLGASIKLLGTSQMIDGKVYSMVAPFMIDEEHPLKNVNGVFNGIYIDGNMLGGTMFYGKGAGKLPTASAVVSDVIDAAKHQGTNIMTIWEEEKLSLGDIHSYKCNYFVRVDIEGTDEEATEKIEKAFPKARILQAENIHEFAFMTGVITQAEFEDKIKDFDLISRIRTTEALC
ncbi:MAG: homoserine dehydrogenase [Clostridium sp.]|nr:homoserine dehydrogenase [Clostridium sp.]MCM1172796.1 homoserine dehydrogenase [Clostridium sp.]MCM1208183.1 homoserine dehydrogenase [Ruminococcus sp.]